MKTTKTQFKFTLLVTGDYNEDDIVGINAMILYELQHIASEINNKHLSFIVQNIESRQLETSE